MQEKTCRSRAIQLQLKSLFVVQLMVGLQQAY